MRAQLSSDISRVGLSVEPYRILVYGDFGRRKTTFAGTWPKALFIDTNGGMVSVALTGGTPLRYEPDGHEDLEALYWWIKEQVEQGDIETIVIDTIPNLALILMQEITEDAVQTKKQKGTKVSLRMQLVPEQGDHYASQLQMFTFLNKLRKLNKHIVLICSQRTKNGKSAPDVSDGMEKVICDFVSVVGEMIIMDEEDMEGETDKDLYAGCGVMLVQESNGRSTKSRYRSIKPYLVDPTFEKFDALVSKEISDASSKAVK